MPLTVDKRAGFSLVELMIVMAILAILSLVTAPALTEYIPAYRADNATKAVATEFQLARMTAIAKNLRHRVSFDTGAQTITLSIQANFDDATTFTDYKTLKLGASGEDFKSVLIGRNDTNADGITGKPELGGSSAYEFDGNDHVTFLPNGRTDESGFIFFIPIQDKGDNKNDRIRALEVEKAGMLQKYRYDGDEWSKF